MTAVLDQRGHEQQVESLPPAELLSLATEVERRSRAAERDRLRLAYQWCVSHPAPSESDAARWSDAGCRETRDVEEVVGGDGTPKVAAFAADELAAVLGLSAYAGLGLLADALNLVHRHPLTWARVESLEVPAWRARRVAQQAAGLSYEAARWVDEQVAHRAGTVGVIMIDRLVAEAAATFDPAEAEQEEVDGEAGWHVTLEHPTAALYAGTSYLDAAGDTQDLTAFHHLVCQVAHQLHLAGDTGELSARKAKALGIIAARAAAGRHPLDVSGDETEGWRLTGRGARAGATRLYLHVTAADLAGHLAGERGAVGAEERLGAVTLGRISEWLTGSKVTVQPVLRLDECDPRRAVDQHDPPEWMRELVIVRDAHCVHPYCATRARSCDVDHIDPYVEDAGDGRPPPGQTRPDNLAPLCRRHHRAKTHGGWRYQRNRDGTYSWRSPSGRRFLVTRTTTIPLS